MRRTFHATRERRLGIHRWNQSSDTLSPKPAERKAAALVRSGILKASDSSEGCVHTQGPIDVLVFSLCSRLARNDLINPDQNSRRLTRSGKEDREEKELVSIFGQLEIPGRDGP